MGEPGGLGPWFCAFVVNTAARPKKYTHVVAHTMPHLVVDALNRNVVVASNTSKKRTRDEDDCWILVFKIGPFNYWFDSVAFLNQWLSKTRGKTHRMERGLELFATYREQFCLCLWTQTRQRNEALAYFKTQQPVLIIEKREEREKDQQAESSSSPSTLVVASDAWFKQWIEETRSLFVREEQPSLGSIRARVY